MTAKTAKIISGFTTVGICLGIFFTKNYNLFGLLIGFLVAILNNQWLFRDARKAQDDPNVQAALVRYKKSLFSRLGMITMVVVVIGKYKNEWLLFLALGIAVGVIISLALATRQQLKNGRG